MLAQFLRRGVGESATPRLTDLVKDRVGVLGRLVQFRAEFALKRAAIGMDLAVDIADLVYDGNPPPRQLIDMN